MQVIILAGGFGTRLQALVPDLPKPMAPVAGRPFLGYVMDNLRRYGASCCPPIKITLPLKAGSKRALITL